MEHRPFRYSACLVVFALCPIKPVMAEAWQPTGGPEGGDVHALSVSGRVVYAGTYEGGIYRSDDLGESWSISEGDRALGWVKDIRWLGRFLLVGSSQGLFRSGDGGRSWTRLMATPDFPPLPEVEAFVTHSGAIIACVRQVGLVRSADSGLTWKNISNAAPHAGFLNVTRFLSVDSAVFACGPGVMKSVDGGLAWTDITGDMQPPPGRPILVYCLRARGPALYAGLHGAVLRSRDGGTTWSPYLAFHPDNAVLDLALAGGKLFIGTNTDGLWSAILDSATHTKVPGLVFSIRTLQASDSGLFAGTGGGGVFLSRDGGGAWVAKRKGMRNQTVTTLAARDGMVHAGCYLPGVFRSSDKGTEWQADEGVLRNAGTQTLAWHGDRLFAGMRNRDGIYRSDDSGFTWKRIGAGRMDSLEVLCLASLGGSLYAGSIGLFRSKDHGLTWQPVAESALGPAPVHSLSASGSWLHVGSAGGYYRIDAASGAVTASGLVSGVVLSMYSEGRRIVAGVQKGGIWRSEDEGLTWSETGMKHPLPLALAGRGGTLFAGTDGGGVFRSLDSGGSWEAYNPGDLHRRVLSLALDGNRLYAGTNGASVFRLDLEGLGSIPGRTPRLPEKLFRITLAPGNGIQVRFLKRISGEGRFRINGGNGRLVAERNVYGDASGFPAPLEFPGLPPGFYLMGLQTRQGEDVRWERIRP